MLHYTRTNAWSQSESASEGEDWEASSRVGDEYQAELPAYRGSAPHAAYRPDESELCSPGVALWQPQKCRLTEKEIEAFITAARKAHSYSPEQALGMLQFHNFDRESALNDMANFVPFPEEMVTVEEQAMFEEAYSMHGKCFRRIHEIMSDKHIGSLIRFYYHWKKGSSGTGAIERRDRHVKTGRVPALEAESGSESDGSSGSNTPQSPDQASRKEQPPRPYSAAAPTSRKPGRIPRGFNVDGAKLTKAVTVSRAQMVEQLRGDVAEVRRHIQCSKEELRGQDGGHHRGLEGEEHRHTDSRKPNRWTEDEVHVALQSLRTHGKDFNAMSALLEHKNAQQCRNFYMNHRRRLNLDRLVAEAGQPEVIAAADARPMTQPALADYSSGNGHITQTSAQLLAA